MSSEEDTWSSFYRSLNRFGPRLLTGVHSEFAEYIQMMAEDSDYFYSDGLHSAHYWWIDGDRVAGVRRGFDQWVLNVKLHLDDLTGPDSLFPFNAYGISEKQRLEWRMSIDEINIRLSENDIQTFIDSVLLNAEADSSIPTLLVRGVIVPYHKDTEGELVRAMTIPWRAIVRHLAKDWTEAFRINDRQWEEMVAAAFDQDGYDEVILTPRSGDHGRDVIAVRRGVGSVRIIASVKAYKPGHLVKHDDVRSLIGVLHGDLNATKGIVTTTFDFSPRIRDDPFIKPLLPYRLELMNGVGLRQWLEELALSNP